MHEGHGAPSSSDRSRQWDPVLVAAKCCDGTPCLARCGRSIASMPKADVDGCRAYMARCDSGSCTPQGLRSIAQQPAPAHRTCCDRRGHGTLAVARSAEVIVIDWSDLKPDKGWCLLRAAVPVGGRTLTLLDSVVPGSEQGTPGAGKRFRDREPRKPECRKEKRRRISPAPLCLLRWKRAYQRSSRPTRRTPPLSPREPLSREDSRAGGE